MPAPPTPAPLAALPALAAGDGERIAARLRGLAQPVRLAIVCRLADGPLTVGALGERLGLPPGSASRHLLRLHGLGLLAAEKRANQVYYRLRDRRLLELLDALHAICPR